MKKIISIFLMFIVSVSILYSSEFSDPLLDQSIDAFSKKNYVEALRIIDQILLVEPDNEIASMYKQTIEEVMNLDAESEIVSPQVEPEVLDQTNPTVNSADNLINKEDVIDEAAGEDVNDIISVALYMAENSSGDNSIELRSKLILGLPIIDIRITSQEFEFDFSETDFSTFPYEDVLSLEDYTTDLGLGIRYLPFKDIDFNTGFIDIKVGATNFSDSSYNVVPYIGFDTELFIFSPIADNLLTRSIWFGGGASVYSFDGSYVNNFSAEIKGGIRIGSLSLGAFHYISNYDSFDDYDRDSYGFILGFLF